MSIAEDIKTCKSKTGIYRIIVFALISLLAYSCGNKNDYSDKAIFRYNESKGIPTLDPAFAKSQVTIWPVNQIFNGLVQYDDSMNVLPCIAKHWEISDSGKTYKFILRNDVFFHKHTIFKNPTGRKVTAHDFVYSLNRILDPKVASPGTWIFSWLNKSLPGNGITAQNDSTLTIQLSRPFPSFLGLLTMQYCSVVPKEIVEYYGAEFRSNPVGTGPFYLKLWVEGEKLVMLRNENYFEKDKNGKQLPYLDAINISFINDKQSEFMEFIVGRLDFISGISSGYKDELITRQGNLNPKYKDKFELLKAPFLNTEYLAFLVDTNMKSAQNSPAKIKKVRQAINYAFDRKKMMLYLRNNIGKPAENGFIPMGMPGFTDKLSGYTYDTDKARELLSEAGFPEGKGLGEITLTTTNDYLDLCEYIQHELSTVGIKIKIDLNSGATFRDMIANSKLPFFRGSWIADYADSENYLALFYSKNFCPSGPNYTHFSSDEFDKLYEASLNISNEKERFRLYRKMDSLILKEAAVVPLFYDESVRFVNKAVSGLGNNPMNLLTLKKTQKVL